LGWRPGGYAEPLEAAAQRSVKTKTTISPRRIGELSKQRGRFTDLPLSSGADVLLLDGADNYLDANLSWLERQIQRVHRRSRWSATIARCSGTWRSWSSHRRQRVLGHGGSYRTFPEARARRQEMLGNDLKRWNDEERRLFRHMKIMKQRAALNGKPAPADAAETRWEKFVKAGPPPPPVPDQQILVKLRGADAARRVLQLTDLAIDGLVLPFSHEIYHGERIGLIGPNGTGKTHLLEALARPGGGPDPEADFAVTGSIKFGPRTSVGMVTQVNDRPEFTGRTCLDIVRDRRFDEEQAMKALARYRIGRQSRQEFETLSGGQKARLEILCLELDGHNVLLLDEPTDNLDVDSAEALEQALDGSAPCWRSATTAFLEQLRSGL
jgi:ATPase subunit of ABC transporter with duplicated ATPase domains